MKRKKILFVCLANMCRSPMAEAILKDIVAKDRKLTVSIDSAAMTDQYTGAFAVLGAVKEMQKRGLDITKHVSKPIDTLNLSEYDLILTMEKRQQEEILASYPKLKGRVFTLADYAGHSGDIDDPIHTGRYAECADLLASCIIRVAKRLSN